MALADQVLDQEPLGTLDRDREPLTQPPQLEIQLGEAPSVVANAQRELNSTRPVPHAALVMLASPIDSDETLHAPAPPRRGCAERSRARQPGRSSRCSQHNSLSQVPSAPPAGGAGLHAGPLPGHAAKALSRRKSTLAGCARPNTNITTDE